MIFVENNIEEVLQKKRTQEKAQKEQKLKIIISNQDGRIKKSSTLNPFINS